MALPPHLLATFSAAEINFRAEEEIVEIVPKRPLAPIELPGLHIPALRPLRRAKVPLWLALALKKQDRCSIVFPKWLEEERLQHFVEEEKARAQFAELPWMWQPLSQSLLTFAADDFMEDVDTVRGLLQDLKELRMTKIRDGLQLVNESHMQMDGIGLMELNEARPIISQAMSVLQKAKES